MTTYTSAGGEFSVTLNPSSTPPRAEIAISWTGASTATLTRTDPNGDAWPVLNAEPATLTSGAWSGYDYELPYGVPTRYTLSSPDVAGNPTINTGIFDVPFEWRAALIQPAAPALSVPILLAKGGAMQTVTRKARQVSLTILGRTRPIVVTDMRESRSSSLMVICRTAAELSSLDSLMADGSALRLAVDPRQFSDPLPQMYVSFGDMQADRVSDDPGMLPQRIVTLPFTEVDRPTTAAPSTGGGGTGGGTAWTYDRLASTYTTYDDVDAAFNTYADLALNRAK